MHPRFTLVIIIFASFCRLNAAQADSAKSYLWGLIQFSSESEVEYEPGYRKDQFLHRREFHEPIKFLPAEVRYGVFIYGGGGADGDKIKSDWMKYEDAVSGFDGGNIIARTGHQLDIDFLKTNLFYALIRASWIDMQTGLNFRYSNLLIPGEIDRIETWGSVNPNWDPGKMYFAPRVLNFGISHTTMLQWYEPWYIDFRYTWGYAYSQFYKDSKKELLSSPTAFGPSMSFSFGPRFIIGGGKKSNNSRSKQNRFSFGVDLRYAYTKFNDINDPNDITPIKQFHLQDFGIHFTFSIFYGGRLTIGDKAKSYYYRKDFITAHEHFETFLKDFPDHSNRKRAEEFLVLCKEKIPIQLYEEGIAFEKKGMFSKSIARYLDALKRADSDIRQLIQDKLDHIAILEIEKADLLSAQGRADEAVAMMEKIKHFSTAAREKIPLYKARHLLQQGEKALSYGFYSKSLLLLDEALQKDSHLEFEVSTLRYQVATHLVEMANKVSDHSELRSAIQMLVDASKMTGGLGDKNEKILNELLIKFNIDQDREMTGRIDQRMEVVRQRAIIKESTPPLTIGMTVPDIQSLLGYPKEIIEKKDNEGSSIQLWIYPLEDGGEMYLSFKDYILFKIEKNA
ncbi:MAG: hypothetical protein H8E70_03125 [Candidatus Marinimicrobia bacterium]|nr:hypothetical protein [Candidatus Neomarinimicrobiota bacterium]